MHCWRIGLLLLLCLGVQPAQAQIRAPIRPRPFDVPEKPANHSIVTLWADALDSLQDPNPILRWHAVRLAAAHPHAFEETKFKRAFLRERDQRVRTAYNRTFVARGDDDAVERRTSAPSEGCRGASARWVESEVRKPSVLLPILEDTSMDAAERTALTRELALSLRQDVDVNKPKARSYLALRRNAAANEATLLRSIARDPTVARELRDALDSEDPMVRLEAVEGLIALGDASDTRRLRTHLERADETDVGVLESLLRACRLRNVAVSPERIIELDHRLARVKRDEAGQTNPHLGYRLERLRVLLTGSTPGRGLYDRAQRELRSWLAPTHPLALAAIHLWTLQPHPDPVAIAPFVDDHRPDVRFAATRALLRTAQRDAPLLAWLRLDARESAIKELLDGGIPPTAPMQSALWEVGGPVMLSWSDGHGFRAPAGSELIFSAIASKESWVCASSQWWPKGPVRAADL